MNITEIQQTAEVFVVIVLGEVAHATDSLAGARAYSQFWKDTNPKASVQIVAGWVVDDPAADLQCHTQ